MRGGAVEEQLGDSCDRRRPCSRQTVVHARRSSIGGQVRFCAESTATCLQGARIRCLCDEYRVSATERHVGRSCASFRTVAILIPSLRTFGKRFGRSGDPYASFC